MTSSPTKGNGSPTKSNGTVADAQKFLEESVLPQLLEDFVVDCAKARPTDVVNFMAQWAAQRANKGVLNQDVLRTGSSKDIFQPTKHPVLLALLGLEDRDDLLEMVDTEVEERSEALQRHVQYVRSQLKQKNINSPSFACIESETHTFVIVDVGDIGPTRDLLSLLSAADGAILAVQCTEALKDFSQRREGHLYNQVLAANGLGLSKAIAVLLDHDTVSSEEVQGVLSETALCLSNSGFDVNSVPMIRFNGDSAELTTVGDQIPFVPRKLPSTFLLAAKCEVTIMALGGDGLSVGESLMAFCRDHFGCRIDAINAVIDKRTSQVVAKSPFLLKRGEVGVVKLNLLGTTGGAYVASGAQVLLCKGQRVAAFGSVSFLEGDEDSSEGSDDDEDSSSRSANEEFDLTE